MEATAEVRAAIAAANLKFIGTTQFGDTGAQSFTVMTDHDSPELAVEAVRDALAPWSGVPIEPVELRDS
jgi:hypothetical protein